MAKIKWLKEEEEILYDMEGLFQNCELAKHFMKESRKRKIGILRSSQAIQTKAYRLGLDMKGTDDSWTMRALTQILKLNKETIGNWITTKKLSTDRSPNGKQYIIRRKHIIKMAKKYPELLNCCDPDGLRFILDKLPDGYIYKKIPIATPVIYECRGKSKVYPTVLAAARDLFISPGGIRWALNNPIAKKARSYQGTFKRA
jgi:hypothetical protein